MRISAEGKVASMYLRFDPCTIVRYCAARAFTVGDVHRLADLLVCAIFPTFNSERVSFEIAFSLIGLAGRFRDGRLSPNIFTSWYP